VVIVSAGAQILGTPQQQTLIFNRHATLGYPKP
jgi:hypothetical protein